MLMNMAKCWMSSFVLVILLSCKICFSTAQTGETQLNLTRADVFRPLTLECNSSLLGPGGRQEWWYKDTESADFVAEHPNGVDVRSNRSYGTIDPASGSLNIDSFEANKGGQYSCLSSKDGTIVTKFIIRVVPYVRPFPKSRNVMEGDSTSIQCLADGYPRPEISWHYYEEDKPEDIRDIVAGGRVELKESENDLTDGTLVITDLKPEDRGYYVCRASSLKYGLGMEEASILIRVKDRLAAVWPFLGICAEVAILCTIIFVYEKRRNKNTPEDPDADNDARKQLNKNASDHKEANDDLRQRK